MDRTYGPGDGDLLVHTDVTGRAARLGHRLTLRWTRWTAEVLEDDGEPTAVHVEVDVASLEVVEGRGGLKPLSSPEKQVVRRSAWKALGSKEHPRIRFDGEVLPVLGGYDLRGDLTVRGTTRPQTVHVRLVDDRLEVEATVRQSDFGVVPVSFLAHSLEVVDEVRVSCSV